MLVFVKSYYFSAKQTLKIIKLYKIDAKVIELDKIEDEHEVDRELTRITKQNIIPSIFIMGEYFGGNTEL